MKSVIFHGQKIGAWAAWYIQAKADVKGAHEEPIDVEATNDAAVEKAALKKESSKEATYEQKVEAWIERLQPRANDKKAKKKTAKT